MCLPGPGALRDRMKSGSNPREGEEPLNPFDSYGHGSTRARYQGAYRTGFIGVYKTQRGKKFQARVDLKGQRWNLGVFIDATTAAEAVDFKRVELGARARHLNFPESYAKYARAALGAGGTGSTQAACADAADATDMPKAPEPDYKYGPNGPRPPKARCGFRGVCYTSKHRGYLCELWMNNKRQRWSSRTFPRPEEAARAYDRATLRLTQRGVEWLNFPDEMEARRSENAAGMGVSDMASAKANFARASDDSEGGEGEGEDGVYEESPDEDEDDGGLGNQTEGAENADEAACVPARKRMRTVTIPSTHSALRMSIVEL